MVFNAKKLAKLIKASDDDSEKAYEKIITDYMKTGKKESTKAPKKKKDPNAPKKGATAYTIFCNERRAELKEENPDATFSEMSKLLGAEWKAMSDEDKKPFVVKSDADKERYKTEMEAYEEPAEDDDDDEEEAAPVKKAPVRKAATKKAPAKKTAAKKTPAKKTTKKKVETPPASEDDEDEDEEPEFSE